MSRRTHGIVAHGYHLYAPHTKVPFVIKVPGLPAQRLGIPVGHVDLAPTMVNLARGPHEPAFLGRSFVDLLAGQPTAPPPGPGVTPATARRPAPPSTG